MPLLFHSFVWIFRANDFLQCRGSTTQRHACFSTNINFAETRRKGRRHVFQDLSVRKDAHVEKNGFDSHLRINIYLIPIYILINSNRYLFNLSNIYENLLNHLFNPNTYLLAGVVKQTILQDALGEIIDLTGTGKDSITCFTWIYYLIKINIYLGQKERYFNKLNTYLSSKLYFRVYRDQSH